MNSANHSFVQMRKGPCKGLWICVRRVNGRTEYLHSDCEWRTHAGETAYFSSKDDIESVLEKQEPAEVKVTIA